MPIDWRAVDWLRVAHRGLTLARSLRRDRELELDHRRELQRSAQLNKTIEDIARNAVGCAKPDACDCPICTEERGA